MSPAYHATIRRISMEFLKTHHPILKALRTVGLGILILLIGLIVSALLVNTIREPSTSRNWNEDQSVLPQIVFEDSSVTIRNIRNFNYTSTSTYTTAYYDKTIQLDDVKTVDFIVEPFSTFGMAHTFLSFGFSDGTYLSISVEIRKERGEIFSPLKGLFGTYELMYVIADEHDVLPLRAIHRKDPVYLYPIRVSEESARELFVSMLKRADSLSTHPEFYNTLTNTCTTNIVDHMNTLTEKRAPFDIRIYMPAFSDRFAFERGLIDTTASMETLRATHDITDLIHTFEQDPQFSQKIRGKF